MMAPRTCLRAVLVIGIAGVALFFLGCSSHGGLRRPGTESNRIESIADLDDIESVQSERVIVPTRALRDWFRASKKSDERCHEVETELNALKHIDLEGGTKR